MTIATSPMTQRRTAATGRHLFAGALTLCLGFSVLATIKAGDSDPLVESLVRQLGDSSYARREAADHELETLGAPALSALREVVDSRNLELRYRARRLVDVIERTELQAHLTAFAESLEPSLAVGLPGWGRFSQEIGNDEDACRLFAEMQTAEPDLMRLIEQGGPQLSLAVDARCLELRQPPEDPARTQSFGTVANSVLLFALLDPQCQISQSAASSLYGVLYQSQFQLTLRASTQEPVRRLLGLWVAHADQVSVFNRVQLAMRLGLREGADAAEEAIRTGMHDSQLPTAVLAIASLGGTEHIDVLEPLLDNPTVVAERQDHQKGETFTCQVRDIALLAIVHLTGQSPLDYGFDSLQRHSQTLYTPNSAGFKSDKDRDRAFSQWRLWRALHIDRSRQIPGSTLEGVGV